jgi:hypothetical protein
MANTTNFVERTDIGGGIIKFLGVTPDELADIARKLESKVRGLTATHIRGCGADNMLGIEFQWRHDFSEMNFKKKFNVIGHYLKGFYGDDVVVGWDISSPYYVLS